MCVCVCVCVCVRLCGCVFPGIHFHFLDPYLLSLTVVLDHLLDEELGLAVGVGAAAHWVLLVDGQVLGVPVHRGRAAEDQIAHSVSLHHLGNMQMHTNTAHAYSQQLISVICTFKRSTHIDEGCSVQIIKLKSPHTLCHALGKQRQISMQ